VTVDLARLLLEAYRAAAGPAGSDRARAAATRAAVRGAGPGAGPTGGPARRAAARSPGEWSGPGADDRDPQLLERSLSDLVSDLGWSDAATTGRLQSRWPEIVGSDVAAHSTVLRVSDGDLVLKADSTAWATQLTLLSDRLLDSIQRVVGESVRSIRIEGPGAPRWRRGPLRVPGRGPRDTYG
jgi:predicted nucleic acid-binding Zn ribbon protein